MKKKFQATVTKSDRLTYIEIPFDPSKEFSIKGKMELRVTINEVTYTKSLLSRGNGNYIMTLNKDMISKLGISVDGIVDVLLESPESDDKVLDDDSMIIEMYKKVRIKKEKSENLDILEAIFTRRSIRKFNKEKIENDKVELLLKAGLYAPTAENKKPIEFILVRETLILEEISNALPRGKMVQEANCAIVVCGNTDIQKQKGFVIEDGSASIQNILLAAHGMNLSAVWCGVYPMSKVVKDIRNIFELPSNIFPIGIVAIGYSEEERVIANRYDKEKIHIDKW
ncbi:nitroreductase family protein [Fusibacter ferrireducens]|uniref:Nitroreductase family protein n=1 Tax=Fusibacter ferrireducens TaxID=2785058 RepID=A0ABR9ZM19_9FIRM|nr:nitroreductase family protein [Fusibacter ferrireducens]MBF4691505.1 nitroreductase family protein [Fusibacter ferrireducens]